MVSLTELPVEIVAEIVRHANLNGDLSRLRLCHSQLVHVISEQRRALLSDLCAVHGVTPRALDMCFLHGPRDPPLSETATPSVLQIITLGHFLQDMSNVVPDTTGMVHPPAALSVAPSRWASKEPFVLFAVVSRLLNDSATVSSMTGDLLAPSASGEHSDSRLTSERFRHLLRHELTLEELESVIAAINICTNRLWSTILLFSPRDSSVSSFGSLSGVSFNTDQAILTEHVVWKGPRWVSRLLGEYLTRGGEQRCGTGGDGQLDMTLVHEGVWRGSREDGARLAANGVARFLWKEREERIDSEQRADNTGRCG